MNLETIKGNWHQFAGAAKVQWGKLTDDDLQKVAGETEKLAGVLQERYGYESEKARAEADAWLERVKQNWEVPNAGPN